MICDKSFAILFLMLSTASSQEYTSFQSFLGPDSNVGPPPQSSSANTAATALAQSESQNYGNDNTAYQALPYGSQQSDGQSSAFDNGLGLQNQGTPYSFPYADASDSGFRQANANKPEGEIIEPSLGVPYSSEPSSSQVDAGHPWPPDNDRYNFPGFPFDFPQDTTASTWKMSGSTENSPAVSPGFPWIPGGFPGNSPGFTPNSGDYNGKLQEPGPVADPLPPPPLVGYPDTPIEPSFVPIENAPVGGDNIPDTPSSGFPFMPRTGDPTLSDYSQGLSTFDNWQGAGIGNSASSSSSQSSVTSSGANFPDKDGGYERNGADGGNSDYGMGYERNGGDDGNSDYGMGYERNGGDDGNSDYGMGYDVNYEYPDYHSPYLYSDNYEDYDYLDNYSDFDYDSGDYYENEDDGNDGSLTDGNPQSPQPLSPPELHPSQFNGNGFGGGIIPWLTANQWNFFPGPIRRCCNHFFQRRCCNHCLRRRCCNSFLRRC